MTYLHLAYYRGKGDIQDKIIRWATRSTLSHVELVLGMGKELPTSDFTAMAFSSSARDGGVREKPITFTPENWVFQKVSPWYVPSLIEHAKNLVGEKYDLKGLLLSQVLALHRHAPKKWFCSEFCAKVLEFDDPQGFSPSGLFYAVARMNEAFLCGRQFEQCAPASYKKL